VAADEDLTITGEVHMNPRRSLFVLTVSFAAGALAFPGAPASAATPPSCSRGGAHLEAASGHTRVVRVSLKKTHNETKHEKLLSCWTTTGKRRTVAEEVDFGADNRASTEVEIVQGRFVGVVEENEGGQIDSISARVYDARMATKLHDSADTCDKVDQGDLRGVLDVAFLKNGGLAMSCNRLLLYRNAANTLETVEPAGTLVYQLGVSNHSPAFGQRLFWTVTVGANTVTKSLPV